ncbi:hypothetical protein ACIP9H_33430 [Streptomyces sp. NPDC088732]|uniref:hypothetical protein n=1 Tax=Streptomyces sp. NPDC088732 TaxID=3365879 RepID=UPI0037FAC103
MSDIHFLPKAFTRVTDITIVVPVADVDDLVDPDSGRVVIPAQVKVSLRRDEGTPSGTRESAYVAVIGPRRLKSQKPGQRITAVGWHEQRNHGLRGTVERPAWLTERLAANLPEGWPADLLELPDAE